MTGIRRQRRDDFAGLGACQKDLGSFFFGPGDGILLERGQCWKCGAFLFEGEGSLEGSDLSGGASLEFQPP